MKEFLCRAEEVVVYATDAFDAAYKAMETFRQPHGLIFEVHQKRPVGDGYCSIPTVVDTQMVRKPKTISRKRSARRAGIKQQRGAKKGKT